MKYLIFLLLTLSGCTPFNDSAKKISKNENIDIMQLTIVEYKKMLINYNNSNDYPKIDK
tara:strand:+ start:324 stop:500 length:177 start_codon:yes stop_codon:yes gene_type:complete